MSLDGMLEIDGHANGVHPRWRGEYHHVLIRQGPAGVTVKDALSRAHVSILAHRDADQGRMPLAAIYGLRPDAAELLRTYLSEEDSSLEGLQEFLGEDPYKRYPSARSV